MPATSDKQRKLFAIAESMKKGKPRKNYSPKAAKIAQSLTTSKIRDFTGKVFR